jgi:hypothetical protein
MGESVYDRMIVNNNVCVESDKNVVKYKIRQDSQDERVYSQGDAALQYDYQQENYAGLENVQMGPIDEQLEQDSNRSNESSQKYEIL